MRNKRWSIIVIIPILIVFISCSSTQVEEPTADVIDWLDWKIYNELDGAIASQDPLVLEKLQRQITRVAVENKKVLIETLKSKDEHKRAVCAAAIGFTQDKNLVPHLIDLFSDESTEVKRNAAAAIGYLNNPSISIRPLKKLLNDPNKTVKSAALYALYHLVTDNKDEELMQEALEGLADTSEEVRVHSILLLAKVRHQKATLKIIELLKDNVILVRINSAIALGQIRDKNAIIPLINLLSDDEINVRKSAHIALVQITEQNLPLDYKEWKKWHDLQR